MRFLSKPGLDPVDTFKACYSSLRDNEKQKNFESITDIIWQQAFEYDSKGNCAEWYLLKENNAIYNNISEEEIKRLYSQNLVKNEEGKKIYDTLKSVPPRGVCPFCGIGDVSTLDHYLPKSKFPSFSVLPYNLVACCQDCNKNKSDKVPESKEGQSLHPYYDNFTEDQWLFAEVKESSENKISVNFFVKGPEYWDDVDKKRVQTHFEIYNLANRFCRRAMIEFAKLYHSFSSQKLNPCDISSLLQEEYNSLMNYHKNFWETALYQALYQSEWYCNGGWNCV